MDTNKKDEGFTLVELLIVIVILGILATITVFAVRGITDQGKQNSCAVEQKTIETAIEAYYAQNGVPPTNNDFTVLGGGLFMDEDPEVLAANWTFDGGTAATIVDGEVTVAATPAVVSVTDSGKCATFTG